jgi:hypothetical protein
VTIGRRAPRALAVLLGAACALAPLVLLLVAAGVGVAPAGVGPAAATGPSRAAMDRLPLPLLTALMPATIGHEAVGPGDRARETAGPSDGIPVLPVRLPLRI